MHRECRLLARTRLSQSGPCARAASILNVYLGWGIGRSNRSLFAGRLGRTYAQYIKIDRPPFRRGASKTAVTERLLRGPAWPMSKNRTPKLIVGIVASFMGLAGVIIFLLATKIVSVQIGILMLVMSVGMHLGFGILIAVYRLIGKLE